MTTNMTSTSATRTGWPDPAGPAPSPLAAAASAAAALGKVGRTRVDRVVVVVAVTCALLGSCGLVGLLAVALVAWWWRVARSRRLDRAPWAAAAPPGGARYRTAEVTAPEGLSATYRRYRWWCVLDEDGNAVFGLFGKKTLSLDYRIIPFVPGTTRAEPDIPDNWWVRNAVFHPAPWPRLGVLHWALLDAEPAVAVRLTDPNDRSELEAYVYSADKLEDQAAAVLSCLALFRRRIRPGRRSTECPSPPSAVRTADGQLAVVSGERYSTVEVTPPEGLPRPYRHCRWWSVLDENGFAVFGLFGTQRLTGRTGIIAATEGALPGSDVVPVPPWWERNALVTGGGTDGPRILSYLLARNEPVLTVHLGDSKGRSRLVAVVEAPEQIEDRSVAVLSCLALYRKRVVAGRRRRRALRPAPTRVNVAGGS